MAIKIIIIFICLILSHNNKIGKIVCNLNTFFHESFHALTSLILGNKVKEIEFDTSAEGSCKSISKSKFRTFLCSLAGYIGCALLALLFIFCIKKQITHYTFIALTFLSFFILLFYIRKTYAMLWTICFACINLIFVLAPIPISIENYTLFTYATIILIENTKSCCAIFHLSIFKAKNSGDCYILAKVTHIPSFVWSSIFNVINLWVSYKFIQLCFLENYF